MELYRGDKEQREKELREQIRSECERVPEEWLEHILIRAAEAAYAADNMKEEEREKNKERLHIIK